MREYLAKSLIDVDATYGTERNDTTLSNIVFCLGWVDSDAAPTATCRQNLICDAALMRESVGGSALPREEREINDTQTDNCTFQGLTQRHRK